MHDRMLGKGEMQMLHDEFVKEMVEKEPMHDEFETVQEEKAKMLGEDACSDYSEGSVVLFQVGSNGDPIPGEWTCTSCWAPHCWPSKLFC